MQTESDEIDVRPAVAFLRKKLREKPRAALVLGSGLGDFADELSETHTVDTADIPSFPRPSVEGHAGKVISGVLRDGARTSSPILLFKGRVHYYESRSIRNVVFPVRLAHALGVRTILLTNAAGGINRKFAAGDLMLIRDCFSLSFLSIPLKHLRNSKPLSAFSRDGLKWRDPFSSELQALIRESARKHRIDLKEGTYCWLRGPSYETAAEIRMLSRLGADAVGMSTVPEISAAVRLGMQTAALSLISNLATGISAERLSHAEVTETAHRVKSAFTSLIKETLLQL